MGTGTHHNCGYAAWRYVPLSDGDRPWPRHSSRCPRRRPLYGRLRARTAAAGPRACRRPGASLGRGPRAGSTCARGAFAAAAQPAPPPRAAGQGQAALREEEAFAHGLRSQPRGAGAVFRRLWHRRLARRTGARVSAGSPVVFVSRSRDPHPLQRVRTPRGSLPRATFVFFAACRR